MLIKVNEALSYLHIVQRSACRLECDIQIHLSSRGSNFLGDHVARGVPFNARVVDNKQPRSETHVEVTETVSYLGLAILSRLSIAVSVSRTLSYHSFSEHRARGGAISQPPKYSRGGPFPHQWYWSIAVHCFYPSIDTSSCFAPFAPEIHSTLLHLASGPISFDTSGTYLGSNHSKTLMTQHWECKLPDQLLDVPYQNLSKRARALSIDKLLCIGQLYVHV